MNVTKRLCLLLVLIGATGTLSGCLNVAMRHPVLRDEAWAEMKGAEPGPYTATRFIVSSLFAEDFRFSSNGNMSGAIVLSPILVPIAIFDFCAEIVLDTVFLPFDLISAHSHKKRRLRYEQEQKRKGLEEKHIQKAPAPVDGGRASPPP